MRRIALLALFIVTAGGLAAGLACLLAGPAAAKEFAVRSVTIDAVVRPNGDMRVTETRVLDFSGDFSFVYWDLNTRGSDGIDVTAARGPNAASNGSIPYEQIPAGANRSPGTYWFSDNGDTIRVQLNFSVADTSASFSIDYVARGAAKRWADTSEVYWQFVGDEAQIESEDVKVTVHLPDGVAREQVQAWAHGPLWGEVTIAPDATVVMAVSPLPAATFVEGRILFPAAALPGAPQAGGARKQTVLDEEQQRADEANRERREARIRVILWGILGFGVPLLALIVVLWLYVRHGREPRTQFQAEYLRDVPEPDLPPALASFIWHMGGLRRDDVVATLLDLVNRKIIDLERVTVRERKLFGEDETGTYKLTLREERMTALSPEERDLVTFLFYDIAGNDTLVLSELKDLAKDKREEFAKGYGEWQEGVKEDAGRRGYLVPHANRMAIVGAVLSFGGIIASFVAMIVTGWYWFLVGLPVCVVLLFVSRAIKRRSPEAAELHAQYAALERYLKDFGRMQEKPPDAVVLWEHFLVYAVVFGIANEVVKAMAMKVPEVVHDPAFAPVYMLWFAAPGDGGGGVSAFSQLHDSFGEAVSIATSSSSSGAGGGGGFSGGGGGGGGGGGFGAG